MKIEEFILDKEHFISYKFPIGTALYDEHNSLNKILVKIIDELEEKLKKSKLKKSGSGGTNTKSILTNHFNRYNIFDYEFIPEIKLFKTWVTKQIFYFIGQILKHNNKSVYISCWANKLGHLDCLDTHIHTPLNGYMGFSSHYDVAIPDEYCYTKYESPLLESYRDENVFLGKNKAGRFTIISNKQPHSTTPVRHPNKYRYTLGMDIFLCPDEERDVFCELYNYNHVQKLDKPEDNKDETITTFHVK